jgi:hypothetical protein
MSLHHDDNPMVTILLSMGAGLLSWFGDPVVWRAVAIAALCGFAGGIAKAAGFWAWRATRIRRNKSKRKHS